MRQKIQQLWYLDKMQGRRNEFEMGGGGKSILLHLHYKRIKLLQYICNFEYLLSYALIYISLFLNSLFVGIDKILGGGELNWNDYLKQIPPIDVVWFVILNKTTYFMMRSESTR